MDPSPDEVRYIYVFGKQIQCGNRAKRKRSDNDDELLLPSKVGQADIGAQSEVWHSPVEETAQEAQEAQEPDWGTASNEQTECEYDNDYGELHPDTGADDCSFENDGIHQYVPPPHSPTVTSTIINTESPASPPTTRNDSQVRPRRFVPSAPKPVAPVFEGFMDSKKLKPAESSAVVMRRQLRTSGSPLDQTQRSPPAKSTPFLFSSPPSPPLRTTSPAQQSIRLGVQDLKLVKESRIMCFRSPRNHVLSIEDVTSYVGTKFGTISVHTTSHPLPARRVMVTFNTEREASLAQTSLASVPFKGGDPLITAPASRKQQSPTSTTVYSKLWVRIWPGIRHVIALPTAAYLNALVNSVHPNVCVVEAIIHSWTLGKHLHEEYVITLDSVASAKLCHGLDSYMIDKTLSCILFDWFSPPSRK